MVLSCPDPARKGRGEAAVPWRRPSEAMSLAVGPLMLLFETDDDGWAIRHGEMYDVGCVVGYGPGCDEAATACRSDIAGTRGVDRGCHVPHARSNIATRAWRWEL